MQITSRDNSLLRQARAVRDGKVDDLIFVEGLRLCVEALRADLELEAVIVSDQLAGNSAIHASSGDTAMTIANVMSSAPKKWPKVPTPPSRNFWPTCRTKYERR